MLSAHTLAHTHTHTHTHTQSRTDAHTALVSLLCVFVRASSAPIMYAQYERTCAVCECACEIRARAVPECVYVVAG